MFYDHMQGEGIATLGLHNDDPYMEVYINNNKYQLKKNRHKDHHFDI
jgi:hypothetical protein